MSKACQLFSGSSGNSIFISDRETKILVDAGVSAKRLEIALCDIGESAEELTAIFITHEHCDHVQGLRVLAGRYGIPVFTSESITERLWKDNRVNEKIPLNGLDKSIQLGSIEAVPFKNSHDSVECYGYRFNLGSGRSVAVCTDTGYITADAKKALKGTDLVYLESNHEIMMLENGPYPYLLKQRILSRKGHLSNAACAEFAKELLESGTTRLVLSHLSRENNYPEIARQTTISVLAEAGFEQDRDYRLAVSAPENEGNPFIL